MESDPLEDDSSNRSEGHVIHPIRGMESVIATVSGYHGTERFKLIKLIAQTGANYVGALAKSTTHLVCWEFEGKKYDLARSFGIKIVSHRWFEDCLKKGKRLQEGPYTLQSGKQVGPISWKMPVVVDTHGKRKCLLTKDRNMLSDQSNTIDYNNPLEIDARHFDVGYMNWSDSRLLSENSFPSRDTKLKSSRSARKGGKTSKHDISLSNNNHPVPLINGLAMLAAESSSCSSMCSPRCKKCLCDAVGSSVAGEPACKSRRLVKKKASSNILNHVMPGCVQECCLTESCNQIESIDSKCVDLVNLRNMIASSSQGITSQNTFLDCGRNRIQELEEVEDIDELNKHPVSLQSESVSRNEGTKEIDDLNKLPGMRTSTELSCVICWTDFSSTRGILPCGHRFCYSCIQGWADCMASKGKVATCPLCKATFTSITKVEGASSPDQKIYSQTLPCGSSDIDILLFLDRGNDKFGALPSESVCYVCHNREPVDLLLSCHLCEGQWVHTYCLDPPLVPWTCIHCRDLRMLYQRYR